MVACYTSKSSKNTPFGHFLMLKSKNHWKNEAKRDYFFAGKCSQNLPKSPPGSPVSPRGLPMPPKPPFLPPKWSPKPQSGTLIENSHVWNHSTFLTQSVWLLLLKHVPAPTSDTYLQEHNWEPSLPNHAAYPQSLSQARWRVRRLRIG